MAQWPSLSCGPIGEGSYFVAYQTPGDFHSPQFDEENQFSSLEPSIFGPEGALAILSGEYQPEPDRGIPSHVVMYMHDPEEKRVALVVEAPLGKAVDFDIALFDRPDLPPSTFVGISPPRPGSLIEDRWDQAKAHASIMADDIASFPA